MRGSLRLAYPMENFQTSRSRSWVRFGRRWIRLPFLLVPLGPSVVPRPHAATAVASPRTFEIRPDSGGAAAREWIEIRNVDLHVTDQIVIRVRSMHGEVLRTTPSKPPALDDVTSFRIRVTAGTVGLTGSDLGALLNTVVFAYPNAPLRDIRVRTNGCEIIHTGMMHKGVDVRFRLHGQLDLTPDGRVRIHPSSVEIFGINGEKVLHLLGLHLESLLDLRGAHGASVKGDDLFLDPTAILPPPAIDGHLAAVRIEGDQVVQEFVQLPDDAVFRAAVHADTVDQGFIYFRGGQLRFGKLLMTDTDLRIVGPGHGPPFDMSLPHYSRQLVAGRSRTLTNQGLVVDMPNFATLVKSDSTHSPSPAREVAARPSPGH